MTNNHKLNRFQIIFQRLLNGYFQFFVSDSCIFERLYHDLTENKIIDLFSNQTVKILLDIKKEKRRLDWFTIISSLYTELSSIKKPNNLEVFQIKEINRFNFSNFQNSSPKYKNLKFLSDEIKKDGSKFIDHFLIHGSYATKDFIDEWSDLDTIVIIKEEVFKDRMIFNLCFSFFQRLSFLCYRFDLLAHHRFILISNFDLNYYPQTILPVVVYKNSLSLFSSTIDLNFRVREDIMEKQEILKEFSLYFEKMPQRRINYWQFKKYLSTILMLPSLLLQSKNIYVYKKDSFLLVKKEFINFDFSIIDQVSEKRNSWKLPYHKSYLPLFLIKHLPIKLVNLVHRIWLYPYTHFLIKNINNFLQLSQVFSLRVVSLANKNLENENKQN